MSLAKAVISGIVKKDPQITTTQNNMDLKIANFSVSVDDNNDDTLRVVAFGSLADAVENSIKAGNKVVVEGQLRTYVGKDTHGQDVKTLELRLSSLEIVSGSSNTNNSAVVQTAPVNTQKPSEVVKFSETEEFAEDLIGEEEMPF
ncbi:single-stranded DNA-binding protein [bacterium]|nr:single-stranded DNA-binding protein [bacterium]